MNLNEVIIVDFEANGFLESATKIHVMAYMDGDQIVSTPDYTAMRELLTGPRPLVIHNGIRFDKRLAEKILGIEVKAEIIDTLPLAWYLEIDRNEFGLESYGDEFGVPKPEITDWAGISKEEQDILDYYEELER